MALESKILGTTMPVLEVSLQPGETLLAEGGELSWMSATIGLRTSAGAGGGGMFGALRRAAGGSTIFLTEYTAQSGPGEVAFAAKLPGQILPLDLTPDGYLLQRHGFLCAFGNVSISAGFQQRLGSGLFGGEGFVLQKLSGSGKAFVELSGELVQRDLQAGERLLVHPGHVGLFPANMPFTIRTIPGIANKLFGADGVFLVELTGPGRVLLQSLTLPKLAAELAHYLPNQSR
ncbi:MAG: TIGR00266 family protein [Candidatus Dormibacteria bacterium]